jgi:hypothetical protein
LDTQQGEEFEPIDKPVRFYENLLNVATQLPTFAFVWTHYQPWQLVATFAAAVLMGVSLWKLLAPPRFSATRCVFVVVGLLCLFMLYVL